MAIDPIQFTGLPQPVAPAADKAPAAGVQFDSLLAAGMQHVDETVKSADAGLQAYAAGADIPVHEVMIGMEKARLTMEMAVEVRNKLVEAYQEFMRMQV